MVAVKQIMYFELKRLFRCKVIGCVVGSFILYGIAALVFSAEAVNSSGITEGNAALYIEGMLCSQLSVFTIGVLSVHCFAHVTSNGEHIFLEQMGVPFDKIVWARLALLFIVCTASIAFLFAITALCLTIEMSALAPIVSISIISVYGIVLLGCLIGNITSNSFVGAFTLFAIAIGSSFINMAFSGLFLQFDSNSLTAKTLAVLTGWGQQPVYIFGFDLSGVALPLALTIGLVWLLILVALVWVTLRRKQYLH